MKLISPAQKAPRSLDESMIPAINIVFLLLIFFMVAGQIEAQNQDLLLPESNSASEGNKPKYFVEIDKHGRYFFDNREFTDSQSLLRALEAGSNQQPPFDLTLKVHKGLQASTLDPFIKHARLSGAMSLNLETTAP